MASIFFLSTFVLLPTFFIDLCLSLPSEIPEVSFRGPKVSFRWFEARIPVSEEAFKNGIDCIWPKSLTLSQS